MADGVDVDVARWESGELRDPQPDVVGLGGGGADDELLIVAGDDAVDACRGEVGLDGVEVDAQPEGLDEARLPSDDLEHPVVGVEAREVAGRQLVELGAAGEIGLRRGVTEHHVGSAVDELPDAIGHPGEGAHLELSAGDRHPDRLRVTGGDLGRQVRHARRGLGLSVHDVELDPPLPGPGQPLLDPLGSQSPAGLGHESQGWDVDELGSGVLEELVGVRHAGDVRHLVTLDGRGEARVDHRCRQSSRRSLRRAGASGAPTGRSSSAGAAS